MQIQQTQACCAGETVCPKGKVCHLSFCAVSHGAAFQLTVAKEGNRVRKWENTKSCLNQNGSQPLLSCNGLWLGIHQEKRTPSWCIMNQPLIWFGCSISRKMFSSCCCPRDFTPRSKCQDLSLVSRWKFALISGSEGKCFAILTNFSEFPYRCWIPTELKLTSFMLSAYKS